MSAHSDLCTHLSNEEDKDILTRKLFNVNLRLMRTSLAYRNIIEQAAAFIVECANTTREGYKTPHGFSAANAGLPFNIIAVRGSEVAILNPRVIADSGLLKRRSSSNCGSLTLTEPIEIERFALVKIEFWDLNLVRHIIEGYLPTHQHEIDHNNGILITDRRVK